MPINEKKLRVQNLKYRYIIRYIVKINNHFVREISMQRINEQELARLNELLNQTSEFIAYFELAENKVLEWQHDVECQASIQLKLLHEMNRRQQELIELSQQTISKIQEHSALTILNVEKTAQNVLLKNEKSANNYPWQLIVLPLLTTLLTAFALGLYMSAEYPWEIHQKAQNERGAGVVLMKAWPILSQQEKNKILSIKPA